MKTYFLTLLLSAVLGSVVYAQEDSTTLTLEQRLEHLVQKLEAKRVEYNIPGMALAVVLHDKIVLEHSFGHSNLEEEIAVTPDTLFAIGSVTKSFTSAAVGVLVDDGKMRWDAPITDYLPWFELPIDSGDAVDEDSSVLISDLLSHQTGFTRMHFLAVNNSSSRKDTLRAAVLAEPWEEFRSAFLYNNVQYLASGYAAGVVDGTDWDTVVEERLLEPIGMKQTYTSRLRAPNEEMITLGYQWDEEAEEFDMYPLRTIDNLAPAGSIVSTAGDMARWIRFHLGNGVIDGERVLSKEQHDALWTTHIEMAPGTGYGFGWMLHEDEGVVEHGGNVRGGCAELAMFPEEQLGFVLLMNVSASILQQESISIVRDSMLGAIGGESKNDLDFAPYIGNYVANFGPFQDATFEVKDKDGALAVNVPGQMLYELKPPDVEGKWYFTVTNTVAISFDMNENEQVIGMKMYQGGMAFELPKEGVEIEPDIPLIELQKYLGEYHNEEENAKPTVVIQHNRLALDVPGEMVFELYPPNEDGVWVCRVIDKLQLRFIEDEQQHVTGFELMEGEDARLFSRVSAISKETPQTAESILAAFDFQQRGETIDSLGAFRFDGTAYLKQSGLHGTNSILTDTSGRFLAESDFGKSFWLRLNVVGDEGTMDASFIEPLELGAAERMQIQDASPIAWAGNWPSLCSGIRLLHEEEFEGKAVWTVLLEYGDDPAKTIAIDQKTGDVLVVKSKNAVPEIGGFLPYTRIYRDFKEIDGVRVPTSITEQNEMTGASESTYVTIESGIEVTDESFKIEPRERPTPWIAGTDNQ
ncbi:MAG: CubicO group peptidase (beta-lactamase class C family) [Phycisphaerales bacterium]|jgi:CubicO group peptidase (beta-lactamase class C family)